MKIDRYDREMFVRKLYDFLPEDKMPAWDAEVGVRDFARILLRSGATYGRIQEHNCNSPNIIYGMSPDTMKRIEKNWEELTAFYERKESRIENKLSALCASFGCSIEFQGDPRGHTIKLSMPDKRYPDGRKVEFGVPTS